MKFIHLSDLHIGKRVNEFSMIEDQKYILTEILKIIEAETPDAVIIAGDIYDRSLPPTDAVTELDDFIFRLFKLPFKTFIISGNHDSAERVAFGSRIFENNGIYLSPVYNGDVKPITISDEYGDVNVYMLPFIKPFNVRRCFENEAQNINSYSDAVRTAIEHMNVDTNKRNIIVSHQFVTGAERSDSEEISVGGMDNVDTDVYAPFDYVALGHIHSPQKIGGKEHIRYCGTPLKYSFSEVKEKSVTVVEIKKKGTPVAVRTVPLVPMHDMRTVKGKFEELYDSKFETDDYIRAVLTDENEIPNAIGKLRQVYRNIMEINYDNTRTRTGRSNFTAVDVENKNPLELFDCFFEKQNGRKLSEEEITYMGNLIRKLEEHQNETY